MDTGSIRHNDLVNALEYTFSVYSNELLNAIYIDLHTDDSNAFYIIYNVKGQVIKEDYDLSRRNTLSLDPFPPGLYTIEISDTIHKIVKKVLKF